MELRAPDPEKIRVIEYDFVFANTTGSNTGLNITCFPSLGDTVETSVDIWSFDFPRLKECLIVRVEHVVSCLRRESERVYVDPVELRKRVKEAADVEKRTYRAAKA